MTWTWGEEDEWHPLRSAQFPGFRDEFDSVAPAHIREFSPPFLTALQEPGLVQIWTGIIARTAPDWSLLVRSPANMPRSGSYEPFEGIIETDRWFGPLITNVRLTKTDKPIDFRAEYPLLQVQPIPRGIYDEALLNDYSLVPDLSSLRPGEWDHYYDTVVRPHVQEHRPRGQYAATARKRRKGRIATPRLKFHLNCNSLLMPPGRPGRFQSLPLLISLFRNKIPTFPSIRLIRATRRAASPPRNAHDLDSRRME